MWQLIGTLVSDAVNSAVDTVSDAKDRPLPDVVGMGGHWSLGFFGVGEPSKMTFYDFENNVILDAETMSWGISLPPFFVGDVSSDDLSFSYYLNDEEANTEDAIGGRSGSVEIGAGYPGTILVGSITYEGNVPNE
ncbi:MAG: hypothetical protein AAF485_29015, partial [Chloroflexota bacterium]